MHAVLLAVSLVALVAQGWGQVPSKTAKAASKPAAAKAQAKSVPSKASAKTAAKSKSKSPRKAAARRSIQTQPSPDRYKEIQQALADRGHFRGAIDGVWGPDSVDALRRFQKEQSLVDDGKISSLSLIALGLGPQREAASATTPKPGEPHQN